MYCRLVDRSFYSSISHKSLKYMCFKASFAEILSSGSYFSSYSIRSTQSGVACGIRFLMPVPIFLGKLNSMWVACLYIFSKMATASIRATGINSFHPGDYHFWILLFKMVKKLDGRGPEDIMNSLNLIEFVISRESRKQTDNFEQNTAHSPQIHLKYLKLITLYP